MVILGIFAGVGAWLKGVGLSVVGAFIFGVIFKNGWSMAIKKFSKRGAVIAKEIGETFIVSSKFLNHLDNSIKEDGRFKENSTKELLQAGKEVVAEAKDVIVVIKPKKAKGIKK
jgi:hypothetical protein